MITIEFLEKRAEAYNARIKQLEADLIATRGALMGTNQLLQEANEARMLNCPRCGKRNPVTPDEFAANAHIEVVWCETCKAPSARNEWLGIVTYVDAEYADTGKKDDEPPAGAVVKLPTAPKTPVTSGKGKLAKMGEAS